MADYFDDAPELGEGELSALTALARKLDAANEDVEKAEAKLKAAQAERDRLAKTVLPEALAKVGLSELPLADGNRVVLKEMVRVSLSEANREKGHNWLREIGSAGLIKRKVELQFGAGQDNEAGAFVAECREKGYEVSDAEQVPWNTLDSFARKRLEAGEALPECFTIFESKEAVIVPPAKPKRRG